MKIQKHKNNSKLWNKKVGEANAEQVAAFAKEYQKADGAAWCVNVTEGRGWIAANHVRNTFNATRADGAVAVWVSDGHFAQCIWRKVGE